MDGIIFLKSLHFSVFTSEFTSEVKSNKLSVVTFRFDSIFFQHGNFFFTAVTETNPEPLKISVNHCPSFLAVAALKRLFLSSKSEYFFFHLTRTIKGT